MFYKIKTKNYFKKQFIQTRILFFNIYEHINFVMLLTYIEIMYFLIKIYNL